MHCASQIPVDIVIKLVFIDVESAFQNADRPEGFSIIHFLSHVVIEDIRTAFLILRIGVRINNFFLHTTVLIPVVFLVILYYRSVVHI
jgi:hypothetical protein